MEEWPLIGRSRIAFEEFLPDGRRVLEVAFRMGTSGP